ncbi:hypothetical protein V6N11_043735 [Hibiscus sabdariffa]|uniref:Uncharacterized protein n=1 Tax=Hibiscus sabdariffa TaxID=183260 RepID=A0ABR2RDH7_9ROSI
MASQIIFPTPSNPPTPPPQHTISSAAYGQTWRVLRRNITTQILSLSRIRSYSHARKWVLNILKNRLAVESGIDGEPVRLVDHLRYAMFCLSAIMCFGDKLDEDRIREIDGLERELQSTLVNFNVLNIWLSVTKFNLSYVDSLLELQLPEEKWGLTESEMVSLCSEFLNAKKIVGFEPLEKKIERH